MKFLSLLILSVVLYGVPMSTQKIAAEELPYTEGMSGRSHSCT